MPNPDYWGSYVWSSLVGPQAFATSVGPYDRPHLRAYARCVSPKAYGGNTNSTASYSEGNPVMVFLNLMSDKVAVDIDEDLLEGQRDQYVLTAPDDNLASYNVQLNGILLQEDQDGVPPALVPEVIRGDGSPIHLPAYSISFIVFPEIQRSDCT